MQKMRLAKREIKDPDILREIAEECDVVRIGAEDEEGMFIVPVNFGYDFCIADGKPELTLYIHGASEGRKMRAFSSCPDVAVEMDCRHSLITGDYTCSYSFSFRSIMGNGRISILKTPEEKRDGLTKIMKHMAPEAKTEFSPEALERVAVFRIDLKEFTGKERGPKN